MKIAMIGQKYVPSREGGIEVVVENLSTALVNLGNKVTLFNRRRKEYKKEKEYCGCKIETIFTINTKALDAPVYSFLATLKAKKMAKKGLFDILHFHAEGPCLFLNLLPKKSHRKYKIIVTIHGLDWQRGKWGGLATKVLLRGEKNAVKYADEIIVLSKGVQEYFKKKYNRETVFIPNGVNKPIFHLPEIIKSKWNLEKDSYILFLARIVPEKGLHFLINAWKQIPIEKLKGKKLVIAGFSSHSNTYYQEILKLIQNDASIVLTGFADGQLLEELFSNAYLYVLPSTVEGMPMSLLEAQAYGNNCLVSNIPENLNVIDESSFSFKSQNVDDLKEKIIQIISMNLATHKRSIIKYSWLDVAGQTIKIYNK